MKRKHLEAALCSIRREFPHPDVSLEQYPTSPELAASVVLFALEQRQRRDDDGGGGGGGNGVGDVGPGTTVLDLGCGTGMLGIACALVDTDHVVCVDCDPDALQVAFENVIGDDGLEELRGRLSFVLDHVNVGGSGKGGTGEAKGSSRHRGRGGGGGRGRGRGRGGRKQQPRAAPSPLPRTAAAASDNVVDDSDSDDGLSLRSNCVDTVVTNPPFGTKHNEGSDVKFLKAATRLARRAVYSFHKTSTRQYILKKANEEWGYDAEVVAEMKFDIPQTYAFHKQKAVDVEVDLVRVRVHRRKKTKQEQAQMAAGEALRQSDGAL